MLKTFCFNMSSFYFGIYYVVKIGDLLMRYFWCIWPGYLEMYAIYLLRRFVKFLVCTFLRSIEDVTSISWIFVFFACFIALIEVWRCMGSYSLRDMGSFPPAFNCNHYTRVPTNFSAKRERFSYARRFTCRFLLSQGYLKQWWIIGLLNSKYPKGSLAYWILEVHNTLSLYEVLQTGSPIIVYLTMVWGKWCYWDDISHEVTYFLNY